MPQAPGPERSGVVDATTNGRMSVTPALSPPRSWIAVEPGDARRMVERLFVNVGDQSRKRSAFWVLLLLAAVIASAGVVADSTATVIGAMIVAPLMTPILGTALAIVLADRRQVLHSLGLVLTGALAVIAAAFVLGLAVQVDVVASTNSQVEARVSPRLVDLVAALATGLVGAFALLRSDVSDALPGVAIAISLVPPLAVVGLTLESGAVDQALGALLLFGTNVAAIIATGTALLLVADLRAAARAGGFSLGHLSVRTVAGVAVALGVVAVPLSAGSWHVIQEQVLIAQAKPVAVQWAEAQGWEITDVSARRGVLHVSALGVPPMARDEALRTALDDAGLADVEVSVTLVLGETVRLRRSPP
jgi:uncharacterized hydrophobic protein (TIGR00271 family)